MDRTISVSLAFLIPFSWALAGAAAEKQGRAPGVELKGTVRLPAGTAVDTTAPLDIEVVPPGGARVRGSFLPEGKPEPVPSPDPVPTPTPVPVPVPPPVPGPSSTPVTQPRGLPIWVWILASVLGTGAALAAGLWYYFRRLVPRREMEPYWRALGAIRDKRFGDALPDLTGIETKLPPGLREDARFFIALCHFHLEEETEAEHLAAVLYRERPRDPNVAYLLAYIRVTRGLDAEAEPVLRSLKDQGCLGLRDTRKLLGIVCFRIGMSALRTGDIERAAERFAEVEALGDWAAHIPSDLRNQHVSLGTRALFEQDVKGAREHFEALAKAAGGMPEEQARPLLAKAKVGLALATWLADDARGPQDLETAILEACRLLHAEGAEELPWPEPAPGSAKGDPEALRLALEQADRNFNLPPEERSALRCLRDLHFLRAMAVLRYWSRMDGKAANQKTGEKLREVLSRLACARALDERFADVYLVAGLLFYYLHQPGPERTTGLDLIAEARKFGVRDPDAMEILNNRDKIEKESAGAVDQFYLALDQYLRDETVRKAVRIALLERLATHRSLMNRYRPPDLSAVRVVPATVQEMCDRSETLRVRLGQIRQATGNPELQRREDELDRQGRELKRQVEALEETESELLAMAGKELFKDI